MAFRFVMFWRVFFVCRRVVGMGVRASFANAFRHASRS